MTRYESYHHREMERPVRLDRTEGVVIIEGRPYPAREVIEALAQSGYTQIRAVGNSLVLGHRKITPIYKSMQERALASLCHGSLAYCCPLSKRCAERDRALEVLGLSPAEYERLKQEEHHQFLDAAGSLQSVGRESDEYGQPLSRSVNRPAVDTGYGADDYRMDFDALERALRRKKPMDQPHRQSVWGGGSPPTERRYPPQRSNDSEVQRTQSPTARTVSPFAPHRVGTQQDRSASPRTASDRSMPTQSPRAAPAACSATDREVVGGLGSLFRQGEISPFAEDSQQDEDHRGFCFSCGKTIERGVLRCPFCGALQ